MRRDKTQRLYFSIGIASAGRGMQLVAHSIVPSDAVGTEERMGGRRVKQRGATIPAQRRLSRSSATQAQAYGSDIFDGGKNRPHMRRALPEPFMVAVNMRELVQTSSVRLPTFLFHIMS